MECIYCGTEIKDCSQECQICGLYPCGTENEILKKDILLKAKYYAKKILNDIKKTKKKIENKNSTKFQKYLNKFFTTKRILIGIFIIIIYIIVKMIFFNNVIKYNSNDNSILKTIQKNVKINQNTAIKINLDQQLKKIKELIYKGADVNAKDKSGWTPLMYAARYNYIAIAKLLISNDADINIQGKWGKTALIIAVWKNHPDITKLLIAKGANKNIKGYLGKTALMYALKYNHPNIAKLLIAKGADVNARNDLGWTPLMYAARYNHPNIAKLLIAKGADVNAENNNGWTPLMHAKEKGYSNIVNLLKTYGAKERKFFYPKTTKHLHSSKFD